LQKVGCLIFVCLLISGCASSRKTGSFNDPIMADDQGLSIPESVYKQNLTEKSFFIQKAEIEYINGEQKQKFLATIKFEYPGRYLISLKSRTGIEGARIFVSKDSILINDRINKAIYFGNALYLRKKFGIDQSLLALLFGDFIDNEKINTFKDQCINGKYFLIRNIHGVKLEYLIDCKNRKITSVNIDKSYENKEISFKYDEFKRIGSVIVPKVIIMDYNDINLKVKIRVLKMEYPWNGNVKFFPGKGYELIELL